MTLPLTPVFNTPIEKDCHNGTFLSPNSCVTPAFHILTCTFHALVRLMQWLCNLKMETWNRQIILITFCIRSNETAMHIQENQIIFRYIIFNCSNQQINMKLLAKTQFKISTLEWFLKDHVTLETGVTMLKNQLYHHMSRLHVSIPIFQ